MLRVPPPPPRSGFIEPCLPSPADRPPSGPDWVHEIKHDGYRLMARRDPVGVRLLTRNGHDWADRYPAIVEAVNALRARSCLLDGEAVVCDANTRFYESLMAAIEYHRCRRGWSMAELEEYAQLSEGYFSKALHADNADGRLAGWKVLQQIANALFPDGMCAIKIVACTPDASPAESGLKRYNAGFRTYFRTYLIHLGRLGAKRRNERLTPEQRSAIARRAGLASAAKRRDRARHEAVAPAEAPAPRTKPRWGVGSAPMTRGRHATTDLTF